MFVWIRSAAVLGVVVLAACSREATPPVDQEVLQPSPQAEAQRSDGDLVTAVRARLFAHDGARGSDIEVRSNNGVVTLGGTVPDAGVRQQVIGEVQAVEGVSRVDDQLQVASAPSQPQRGASTTATATGQRETNNNNGAWVTTKILAQYFITPEVKPWNIDVSSTSDGVITLEGEVDSTRASEEAERVARSTDGVTRVENRLRVRGGAPQARAGINGDTRGTSGEGQPDAWVTSKVQAKYFTDDAVKARDIDVTTADGVVTLTGTVESGAERRQAVALARGTDGVREVRDSLTVQAAGSQGSVATRSAGERVEDAWITTKLQASYFLQDAIKGRNVNVDTRNGVVTLQGEVASEAERRLAEEIARDTDGVSRVQNQLRVQQS